MSDVWFDVWMEVLQGAICTIIGVILFRIFLQKCLGESVRTCTVFVYCSQTCSHWRHLGYQSTQFSSNLVHFSLFCYFILIVSFFHLPTVAFTFSPAFHLHWSINQHSRHCPWCWKELSLHAFHKQFLAALDTFIVAFACIPFETTAISNMPK